MQDLAGLPLQTLLILGLCFKVSGFAVRDELWLRILVTTGMLLDVLYYALRAEPIAASVFSNAIIVTINLVLVAYIVLERTTFRMSPEQVDLYKAFQTLTPGHFRKIYRHVRWRETTVPLVLLESGQPVHNLYYVFAETYTIRKHGQPAMVRGPAFVGEIALLTGNLSSARVELPAHTRYVEIPFAALRALMARSQGFHNSIVALFANDLAGKVAQSAPVAPVAPVEVRSHPRHSR